MAGKIYDVVVIGAGWFGLSAAKTYIQTHPGARALILESASSFGGTWSNDRLYPGLKSNNFAGSYEHPDFPMDEKTYGLEPGKDHIPAATLHRYLTDFAKHFGIAERTRLNTSVKTITPTSDNGWQLHIASNDGPNETISTSKLILATGLTSTPNLPQYPGQERFKPTFIHAKDFAKNGDLVHTSKKTVIVGSGKSAYDCAYAFAEQGAQVDLIVRPGGQGPTWLLPKAVTPFRRLAEELLHTRALAWFSPAPWGDEDGYGAARKFLHNTVFGRMLVDTFWNNMTNEIVESFAFDNHPETFKLKPWYNVVWSASGIGVDNFDSSVYDMVRQGKIRVHLADITELGENTVHLSTGKAIETDAVICATGWKKESTLKFEGLDASALGVPESCEKIESLREEANKKIWDEFPMLRNQPVLRFEQPKENPLRNYRFIVPAGSVFKRNLALAGMVSTVSTANFANAQALWINAYFDGKLKRNPKNQDAVNKEVMLHTQFGKWRWPCGYGASLPDFAFDSLPYIDLLLNDVGIKSHRKGSQMAELVEPYKPKDYRGLAEEYLELHGQN
ncbi:hypothetical protein CERZMDRAFT_40830 [Cercospora zeae-maydis SCOH1-5]|uniref:FAD/NAD(P)-binding domain-containing protein n=1 Tax=Cercospora zeae-maydis SCOH1-5 TaxID=717836 RepID=A0A6A6FHQ8_9PEZI|nr:hypothetical protein CERZMDRAFT_40830 [Cercospora zeae-maydis SCOH1-5]